MTKVIYKYPLQLTNYQDIEMPIDSYVLDFQFQNDVLCLWAEVDPAKDMEKCMFYIYGTGHTHDELKGVYQATVQQGEFVWHIYYDCESDILFGEWCNSSTELGYDDWLKEKKDAV